MNGALLHTLPIGVIVFPGSGSPGISPTRRAFSESPFGASMAAAAEGRLHWGVPCADPDYVAIRVHCLSRDALPSPRNPFRFALDVGIPHCRCPMNPNLPRGLNATLLVRQSPPLAFRRLPRDQVGNSRLGSFGAGEGFHQDPCFGDQPSRSHWRNIGPTTA